MNVLLIGSGGREHALAWALSASPLLGTLYCAPGNAGIAEVADLRGARRGRPRRRGRASAPSSDIGFVVVGPEVPLVAGIVDDLTAARIKVFGPIQGGGATRGLQGLHQGSVPRVLDPHGRLRPLHRCALRQGLSGGAEAADRRQGRRPGGRQGRGHRRDDRRGRGGHRRLLRRRVRRRGRRGRDRGVPGGRGGELLRPGRRRARAAPGHGAGPQARRRRRHRPQHRRHGRLLAGARDDARDDAPHDGRDHPPDRARHGGTRHAVQGRAVRSAS